MTLSYAPIFLLLLALPYKWRWTLYAGFPRFILWWLKITCGIHYKVIYTSDIPKQPCIVMCNHQSILETLILQFLFPRPQVWVVKRELLWLPSFGWALIAMRAIAINRKLKFRSIQKIVTAGSRLLEQKTWLIIFPEGTRIAPGKPIKFLPGGTILAKKTSTDIIPVAHNSGNFWPNGKFAKKAGDITFVIGPPVATENKSAREINQEVISWMEKTMKTLPINDHAAA